MDVGLGDGRGFKKKVNRMEKSSNFFPRKLEVNRKIFFLMRPGEKKICRMSLEA